MKDLFKLKFGKNNEAVDEAQLAENLQFLEDILNEEDPEFMKSVGEISIENAAVDESLVDTSLVVKKTNRFAKIFISIFSSVQSPFWAVVLKPLMIHKYPKQAFTFWALLGGLGYGGFRLYKAHFWSAPTQLFLTSYAGLGLTVHDYDMLEAVEPFYDNTRFSKNVMSLIKMTANLRPSDSSSNNPMISFEIVIQGVSNEPIVEIKDREAEFRDLILRVTEEFTYDDLDTSAGKQALSESILSKINANLTGGQVRKVYYKNIVIKP
ncbi:MAG: flagellar basal body-associated FliL family protein [Bdellovibrionota bacterium]